MANDKEELLQWLNEQAQDQYGEFGFGTCSEEDQVDIVYSLVMGIMSAQR
jgi:hypothetical protein